MGIREKGIPVVWVSELPGEGEMRFTGVCLEDILIFLSEEGAETQPLFPASD